MRFEGKLYYDNSNLLPFEEKVRIYVNKYKEATGRMPEACKVHPYMTDLEEVDGIKIDRTIAVNSNFFWIGGEIEDT